MRRLCLGRFGCKILLNVELLFFWGNRNIILYVVYYFIWAAFNVIFVSLLL